MRNCSEGERQGARRVPIAMKCMYLHPGRPPTSKQPGPRLAADQAKHSFSGQRPSSHPGFTMMSGGPVVPWKPLATVPRGRCEATIAPPEPMSLGGH